MSTGSRRLNLPFAAAWASMTLVGWLIAASLPSLSPASLNPASLSPASVNSAGLNPFAAVGLLVIGLLSQLVTAAIRYDFVSEPQDDSAPRDFDREITWWLCWTAGVHQLGSTWMASSTWLVPAALLVVNLVVEVWLLAAAPRAWREKIVGSIQQWFPGSSLHAWSQTHLMQPHRAQHASAPVITEMLEGEADHTDPESDVANMLLSESTHGQLPSGEKFMTGWMHYRFEVGQKQVALTIGFAPPFTCVPEVDLDYEVDSSLVDDAAASVDSSLMLEAEHITPVGMRVLIKRSRISEAEQGKLLWHAVPSPQSIPMQHAMP